MMAYDVIADVRKLSRPEWLNLRRLGLGGSDAGAVLGVNPYRGAYTVWAEKVGGIDAAEDNEAMRQGRDFEDYVARRFEEKTGLKVRREYGMLRSREHPFMIADIDRRVIGMSAGLECKTSKDLHLSRYRNGEFPDEYYAQCLHYLAVTGWDRWYLAVLVYGTGLLVFTIDRAEVQDDIDALIQAEGAFWVNHVDNQIAPPPDGLDSTGAALERMFPESDGQFVEAEDEDEKAMAELLALKEQKKKIELQIATAENMLKARIGEAEGMNGVTARVRWRNQVRRSLNEKLIRERFPDLDVNQIKTESSSRVFTIQRCEGAQ